MVRVDVRPGWCGCGWCGLKGCGCGYCGCCGVDVGIVNVGVVDVDGVVWMYMLVVLCIYMLISFNTAMRFSCVPLHLHPTQHPTPTPTTHTIPVAAACG